MHDSQTISVAVPVFLVLITLLLWWKKAFSTPSLLWGILVGIFIGLAPWAPSLKAATTSAINGVLGGLGAFL